MMHIGSFLLWNALAKFALQTASTARRPPRSPRNVNFREGGMRTVASAGSFAKASWSLSGKQGLFFFMGIVLILSACGGCRREKSVGQSGSAVFSSVPGNKTGSFPICEDELSDVFFLASTTIPGAAFEEKLSGVGIAIGDHHTILRTADGGRTWARVIPRQEKGPEFTQVFFTSPYHGWVVSRDAMLHSSDAGITWQAVPRPSGNFYYFGPVSATPGTVYMRQPPTYGITVYRMNETASSWTNLPGTTHRNDYAALFFLDDRYGWVAGNYGVYARTIDGGATWEAIDLSTRGYLADLSFVTPQDGWMRPLQGHEGGAWRTQDGGQKWERMDAGIPPFWTIRDMQRLDAQTGFLLTDAGDSTQIMGTTNGGVAWTTIAKLPAGVQAICFPTAEDGWAAGPSGCVQRIHLTAK